MGIFDNSTYDLLNKKLSWLNKRTQVISSNIARSDIPKSKRYEITPFQTLMKKYQLSSRNVHADRSEDFISNRVDIFTTKEEIARDTESLELTKNTNEHEAVINILKSYHKMMRAILARQGG
jgi:flagellar basal body rod protein FlgB